MLKQLLASLVVIVVALGGFILFVPGAGDMLGRLGINLPAAAATPEAPVAGPRQGRGPAAMGRRGREMVVVTAPVAEATINDRLSAIGEGAAARSVIVVSPAGGTLVELLVRPGDVVAAGAVIGRLDAEAQQIAFDRANLALEDAAVTLARTEELAAANAATTVQLNTARLAVANARLEVQDAELELRRRTITTPIGGVVGLFQVSPGNALSAQGVVTTIEDTSEILISFWVPERYATAIAPGMPLATSAVALPGTALAGVVAAVDNRIDPASRTLKVQARVPNEAGRLRPGMSFAVTMDFPGETFPSVDPLAIQWSSEGAYVWHYVDGKVERLLVEIIQRNSDGILVQGDLAAGDQVVVQGVQQLSAGAAVRLLDARAASRDGGEPRQ